MNYIEVNIKNPLYDTFVNIRETYINNAIREDKWLRVTIPQGSVMVNPYDWMKTGKRVEQVFKIPDKPMILWGNYVKIKNENQLKLF